MIGRLIIAGMPIVGQTCSRPVRLLCFGSPWSKSSKDLRGSEIIKAEGKAAGEAALPFFGTW